MKIYLTTSNKYTHVCPIAIHFLNKYWPGQDISLLGYDQTATLKNLPENVTLEILGKQSDFGNSWTDALIPFFHKVPEDYFIILLDDLMLLSKVDNDKIKLLEKQFLLGKADKAVIGGGLSLSLTTKLENNLLLFNQNIDYRTTLHPSIWTKKYFLKYLKPNMTAWGFEIENNEEAKNDGAAIITNNYSYPQEPDPFLILNLYNKGRLTIDEDGNVFRGGPPASRKFFNKEDLTYIWERVHAP